MPCVIPGHPARGFGWELLCVPLEFSEVVEGIDIIQFACVNQAHV